MEYINEDREEALLEQTLNKNENDINEMMFILRESIRHFISSRVCGSTEDEPYECDILVGEEEAQGLSEAEKIRYDRIFEDNEGIIWLYLQGTDEPMKLDDIPIETQVEIVNEWENSRYRMLFG